jgi:hypothetical protein
MITRQKITKIHLRDKTETDSTLYGIVSSEADYKISQLLNRKFGISLKHNKNLEITGNNGIKMIFSIYSFSSTSPDISYNLISNKSEKTFLIKKLSKIDYFFQIQVNDNYFNVELTTQALREIDKITAVFLVEIKDINDKNLTYLKL